MTPSFLLDSSVCIPVLRNKAGLDKLPDPTSTGIPAIVAAELWAGVKKSSHPHPPQKERLEAFLSLFAILDFNLSAALCYADIRIELEAAGTPIGPLDMLIAAQAHSIGATLVTANLREFRRVKSLKLLGFLSLG